MLEFFIAMGVIALVYALWRLARRVEGAELRADLNEMQAERLDISVSLLEQVRVDEYNALVKALENREFKSAEEAVDYLNSTLARMRKDRKGPPSS